jgi:hypothetical protein
MKNKLDTFIVNERRYIVCNSQLITLQLLCTHHPSANREILVVMWSFLITLQLLCTHHPSANREILVVPLFFFLLIIVLSVVLRFTDSDYPFGIFKLFLAMHISTRNQKNILLITSHHVSTIWQLNSTPFPQRVKNDKNIYNWIIMTKN